MRQHSLSEPSPVSPRPEIIEMSLRRCANVLGVGIDALNMEQALRRLSLALRSDRKGYVCAIDVHGVLEAIDDPCVAETFARAIIALPDGAPTVWVGRLQGHRSMDHVTGPALMLEVFSRPEFAHYAHFLYGGKAGVAEDLAATLSRRYRSARVVGTYTPPFRDLTAIEGEDLIAEINMLDPDIVWVGIGSPRQDLFMRRMLPRLRTRMMIGVGAAFDFHTGRIRDCSPWVKRAGLQWLHRLAQDPKRLWRRNLGNMRFLWHIATQLSGLKSFHLAPGIVGTEPSASGLLRRIGPAHPARTSAGMRETGPADRACSGD